MPLETPGSAVYIVMPEAGPALVLKRLDERVDSALSWTMLSALEQQGIPVAVPRRSSTGALTCECDGARYALYPLLPGKIIEDHYGANAASRAQAFGAGIARLHQGLERCAYLGGFAQMDLLAQLWQSASYALKAQSRSAANDLIASAMESLELELWPRYGTLPQQLIHRDAHPGNMLVDQGQVSGFIDFDLAVVGARAFDLAYCSTSMLVGAIHDDDKRTRWFELLRALVTGYTTVQPLAPQERDLLWHIQLGIQLIFVAYYDQCADREAVELQLAALNWLYENRVSIQQALV